MPERSAGDRMIAAPTIRPARAADRGAILLLAARFAERRSGWRSEDEVTRGTARVLAAALDAAKDDEAFLVAVDDDDRTIGFIYLVTHHDFFTDEPYVHISELASERDGAGIGRALMAAGEAWTRARGSREITLHVTVQNERAFAIYEKAGFTTEHRKMRKALP